ncbi:MAG: hypothetical protein AMJ92_00825 [candidate division Zixibacteria bacterium SM23_81]|nr:MAG: hypothetical protein AMJ92_00825 [candidate division Zixibacteria bacterium SM23_81]
MNFKEETRAALLAVCLMLFIPKAGFTAGEVYLVMGSDTAIWEGMSTSTYHCTYNIDLYTNPSRNAYGVMNPAFRAQFVDSYGQPLKMTWWMMAGNIFRYATNTNVPVPNIMTLYLMKKYHGDNVQINGDELSLHYHTFAWTDYNGDGLYYWNQSQTFMECYDDWNFTLAQFLLEEQIFPVSFRSGWHYMDNGWQTVLDSVLPYSMHNASPSVHSDTTEPTDNNYDWSQATLEYVPYHPSPVNYQLPGDGPGWNVRCRYFGSVISSNNLENIFAQANAGIDQVACIWSHLPETPFLTDIAKIDSLAHEAAAMYPDVNFRYCTAIEAMQRWRGTPDTTAPDLALWEIPSGDQVSFGISSDEPIFQPVPFVAVKNVYEEYLLIPCQSTGANQWETTESLSRDQLAKVGVVVCDTLGNQAMEFIEFLPGDIFVDNVDSGYVEIQKSWSSSWESSWGLDSRVTTLAAGDTAMARWYPDLEDSATFNIFVQIPEMSNPAEQITYKVFKQGTCVNTIQFTSPLPAAEWVYLSTSYLMPGAGTYLQLQASGDGQEGRVLCADVAKFSALVRERDLFVVDQVLDFGAVPKEDSASLDLRLRNLGYGDLTITGIGSLLPEVTIPVSFPVVIPGMGSIEMPVHFHAQEIGPVSDEMFLYSDDPIEPMAPILVTADVQPYFIIVDNDDSLYYQEEGTWHTSVAQAYGPSSRWAPLNQVPGAKARFQGTLSEQGIYRIYEIVPNTANATNHALYMLSVEGIDADSVFVNQNTGSGSWVHLWNRPFASGQNVEVRVEDTGESTQGDVLRADAIKIAITMPPKAVDDVTILFEGSTKSSSGNIHLGWTEPENSEGIERYIIYRSFYPGLLGDSLAGTMETAFVDSAAVGDPGVQHYYTLKAVDGVGNRSEGSYQVGEFDRQLTGVKRGGFLPSGSTQVAAGRRQEAISSKKSPTSPRD